MRVLIHGVPIKGRLEPARVVLTQRVLQMHTAAFALAAAPKHDHIDFAGEQGT